MQPSMICVIIRAARAHRLLVACRRCKHREQAARHRGGGDNATHRQRPGTRALPDKLRGGCSARGLGDAGDDVRVGRRTISGSAGETAAPGAGHRCRATGRHGSDGGADGRGGGLTERRGRHREEPGGQGRSGGPGGEGGGGRGEGAGGHHARGASWSVAGDVGGPDIAGAAVCGAGRVGPCAATRAAADAVAGVVAADIPVGDAKYSVGAGRGHELYK